MAIRCSWHSSVLQLAAVICCTLLITHGEAGTFTIVNNCDYTVWPGVLANSGSEQLSGGGFELPSKQSTTLQVPSAWSGRVWGRTGCTFTGTKPACQTGDCGGGSVQCNGAGAETPATLAEFTISPESGGQDFYDVSLVDGYNLPIAIVPAVSSSNDTSTSSRTVVYSCGVAGCSSDLNVDCPTSLQLRVAASASVADAGSVVGCRSACDAFQAPEYCCSGAYSNPTTCQPSSYSRIFKAACPRAYSYAYDDPTSTFTCSQTHDYSVIFCPTSLSQKTTDPNGNALQLDSSQSMTAVNIYLVVFFILLSSLFVA